MEEKGMYEPRSSYLRIATACPEVSVADPATNVEAMKQLYDAASEQQVSLVTFPELAITGYTLGDLVNQTRLLEQAKGGLGALAESTKNRPTAMVAGLPLQVGNRLFNCAAVLADGKIQGIVPKTYRPNYNEFYEQRWYERWEGDNTVVSVGGQEVPFGTNLLFEVGDTLCGVEICEDLWVQQPPSNELAAKGALVIANPSASPEQVGKAAYRRNLVTMQSARLFGAYAYAGCHTSESTVDIVMGGHQMIAVDGQLIAERKPFGKEALTIADVDIEHLQADRRKHHAAFQAGAVIVRTELGRQQEDLRLKVELNPFLPDESPAERAERLEAALQIQANGSRRKLLNGSKSS